MTRQLKHDSRSAPIRNNGVDWASASVHGRMNAHSHVQRDWRYDSMTTLTGAVDAQHYSRALGQEHTTACLRRTTWE